MARKKIKYLQSEIENNLYTFGDEWMTEDKQEYKGLYHRYKTTNEVYSGASWNAETSKVLVPLIKLPEMVKTYDELRNSTRQTRSAILPTQVTITPIDITNGFIQRYFLKKVNEFLFFEISEQQFDLYGSKIDNNLYAADSCQWYIVGPIETKRLPIYIPGVIELNTLEIQRMEQTLPGISKKLNNPLEFYTDTDFVVPRDINLG